MKGSRLTAVMRGIAAAGLVLLAAQSAPAFADKLVVFKNGKALRVKSTHEEGLWLKCEFEDKNFISVPMKGVASVEEAASGARDGDLRPNQVAAGSGGGYSGPRGGGQIPDQGAEVAGGDQNEQANTDDFQAALAEEAAAIQRGGVRGGVPGRPRAGVPQPGITPAGQNPGLQQLNQGSPFPNQQGRSGLRQRGTFNRGNVTQLPQNQAQGEVQGEN